MRDRNQLPLTDSGEVVGVDGVHGEAARDCDGGDQRVVGSPACLSSRAPQVRRNLTEGAGSRDRGAA
jgi:hypothetical protein